VASPQRPDPSNEALGFAENYVNFAQDPEFAGRWIAVRGETIVEYDR